MRPPPQLRPQSAGQRRRGRRHRPRPGRKPTAERWGVDAYYDDYHDLLADPEVEAVSVTTWPTAHAGPVIAAAEAGKHILCEKPIATTLEDADAMVAAAERAGVKFTMGYQPRFGDIWPTVKRLIDEGLIGRPAWGSTWSG